MSEEFEGIRFSADQAARIVRESYGAGIQMLLQRSPQRYPFSRSNLSSQAIASSDNGGGGGG